MEGTSEGAKYRQVYCLYFYSRLKTHLGVDSDLGGLGRVSSLVDVDVADALAVPHHGYLRRSLSQETSRCGGRNRGKRADGEGGVLKSCMAVVV